MLDKPTKLLKQIYLGEDSVLELKQVEFARGKITGPHRNSMADELAAMANSNTGVVILGVEDTSKAIVGIPVEKLDLVEAWVREIANDQITPPLLCRIQKVPILDHDGAEKIIVRIDVPKSLFVHQSPGGYLHRIGSSKRKMSPEYLARLFQQRSQVRLIRYDEQIVPQASVKDLQPELWQRFRSLLSPKEDREFLSKMKLIATDEEGKQHPTVSGVLMAAEQPEEFIPNAFIQAVCYRGKERNAAYQLDAKDCNGPLDRQIQETCKFVERNMRVYAIKKPHRIDIPQFSMNAVFEAVVNAVAHRDYSVHGSKIRLHLFSDRLELYSPGTIPNSMTVESLSERQSARNELLCTLLSKCPMNVDAMGSLRACLMDKRGEGVPIIFSESKKLAGRRPVYRLIDDAELLLKIFSAKSPHGE